MSSNRAWVQNFKARCEDVGWRVELGKSGHHKTFDASGRLLFTFASTTGDRRSMLAVLSDAKRAGLLELESRVKLRRERDRLERIELDRRANGHTEKRSEESEIEVTQESKPTPASNSPEDGQVTNEFFVDGVAIVAVAPAKIKTPIMSKPAPMAGADELLLEDQRVVYRCAKPAADARNPELTGLCHRIFPTAEGLRAHITFHSRQDLPTTPSARAARERREEEGKKIAKKLRESADRRAAADSAPPTDAQAPQAPRVSASNHLVTEIQLQLTHIAARTDRLTEELLSIVRDVENVRDAVTKLPSLDPEVAEKAARFDALRGMLA